MIKITENLIDLARNAEKRLKFKFPYSVDEWVNNKNLLMENYHKHTTWSDLVQIDSSTSIEDFIKLSDEYGCKCYFSGEHGYPGEWLHVYNVCNDTKKEDVRAKLGINNPITFRYSVEAYWVKDADAVFQEEYEDKKTGEKKVREKKDNANCHMVIVARTYNAMRKLNYILSCAHDTGFYYKPRIDLKSLFTLNKDEVYITSACFVKGTKVLTDKGYKNIEEIRSGDVVVNKFGRLEKVNFPTRIDYKGSGYCISTNAFHNNINCTSDHKFLTTSMTDMYKNKEPQWMTAKDIYETLSMSNHSKRMLLYPLRTDFNGNNIILKSEYDGINKYVKHQWSVKQHLSDKIIITPELMRLFGYFIGDGHICVGTKNDRIGFSFNIKEFNNYYDSFISKVEEQLGIKFCITIKEDNNKVELSTSCVDLVNLFYYLFGDCNATTKHIPNRLLHISHDLDCELLYGMILSDGCIVETNKDGYISYRMTYVTISDKLRLDFRSLCNDLGIYTTEHVSKQHVDKNGVNHKEAYYISFCSKILDNISKKQSTSHETLLDTINTLYDYGNKKPRRSICGQEYLLIKITNMKLFDIDDEVYCLNNNTHSFISEFAIVHNCIAGWKYEDATEIWLKIWQHFGDSFFLEYQTHNTPEQKALNKKIYEISKTFGIQTIIGLDTHYINEEDRIKRENLLLRKGLHYDGEDGWYMDFPNGVETYKRMVEQDCLPKEEILYAMMNTHVFIDGCENLSYDTDFKIPIHPDYQNYSYEERSKILHKILTDKFESEDDEHHTEDRREGMEYEYGEIDGSGTADYFIDNHSIVDLAINKYNGKLTTTSRGSASSYYSSKLLGFTTMDRFDAEVPIYPERFVTKDRILSSHQMPDIDYNVASQEPFVQAARELFGEHGCYPLLAVGKLGEKSGFKLYADIKGIEPSVANDISKCIDRYNEALKQADDEEDKEDIHIEDYITDPKHLEIFNDSKPYQGIIEQAKCHACGFMLFNGNVRQKDVVGYGDIRYEIGLIRCISESTGKSTIVANIEGGLLDSYGYVKDDFLIVDVVSIINKLYESIGRSVPTVTELRNMVTNDELTWKMYEIGATCCLNQCEKSTTTKRVMRYKPKEIKELAAFIAGIRPGFKSLIDGFLNREEYTNGEKAIDELLKDCFHYMLYQEAVMKIFSWLGIPMKDSYDTIKKISKKKLKGEALKHVEDTLKEHWSENIGNLDNFDPVYKVIKDSARYSFNAPHALAMANDSLYEAWMKGHYTSKFYEVTLNHYQDKDDKNKVALLEKEAMSIFGYKMGTFEYGKDNSKFTVDDNEKIIYPNLSSVKGIGKKAVNAIVEIANSGEDDFINIYLATKGTNINKSVFEKLIKINYFKKFGTIKKLLRVVEIIEDWKGQKWEGRKTLSKADIPLLNLDGVDINKYASDKTKTGISDKQYKIFDWVGLVRELCNKIPDDEFSSTKIAYYQYDILQYLDYVDEKLDWQNVVITDLNTTYSPKFNAYSISSGKVIEMKIHKTIPRNDKRCKVSYKQIPVQDGEVIYIKDCKKEPKKVKTEDGWDIVPGVFEWWIKDYYIVEKKEAKEDDK